MAEETNFIPRKVTNPNDFLDRKSYLCICNVFCNSRAITDEIKYHDKTSNIDVFIQLIDESNYPIGNINSADPNYFIKSYNFSNFVEHWEET